MNPMDQLADEYDRWFDSPEGQSVFQLELRCVREVIQIDDGRWLEVGVGTGRFAAALGVTDGVDPSERALAIAAARGIRTRVGTAERLPFEDKLFDGVVLVATLCFVADPSLALRECRRVLRDDGALVLAIIPANSPWGRLYAEKGKAGHAYYSTATFYMCNAVIRLANANGFTLAKACSCLLSRPGQPLSEAARHGIVGDAGFVCMRFCRAPSCEAAVVGNRR